LEQLYACGVDRLKLILSYENSNWNQITEGDIADEKFVTQADYVKGICVYANVYGFAIYVKYGHAYFADLDPFWNDISASVGVDYDLSAGKTTQHTGFYYNTLLGTARTAKIFVPRDCDMLMQTLDQMQLAKRAPLELLQNLMQYTYLGA
jgi:hypothetical protein